MRQQTALEERLAFAADLARRSGALLRQGYGNATEVRHKGSVELVTEYDVRSEELIRSALAAAFPAEAVQGEEGGLTGAGEGRWLVDPLDGTANFAHGIPIFCVSIAWLQGSEPLLGVVYDPLRDELFEGGAGLGARLNGRELRVSAQLSLAESLLVTGFPYDIRSNPRNNLKEYAALALRSLGVRRLGSAALDLAYVAAGRFDGFWEFGLSPWDFAAGTVLVREAGGRVTRADGGPDVFASPTSLLATNGRIHASVLEVLQEVEAQRAQGPGQGLPSSPLHAA
ncbi:MAG: inositol monophosphatase family protein [Chloroflexota bacterium]